MVTRGQRLYDRWSRRDRALDLLYGVVFLGREARFRRRALDRLALEPGDRVLEVGCGPGNSLAALRAAVGPSGEVVAVDYSSGMVTRAAGRGRAAGWENVHVVASDATRLGLATDAFDAALAAMSLTATADPPAAVSEIARCLRPDGRLSVLDARPFPSPLSPINRVVTPVARRLTDWTPVDVVDPLADAFETVETRTTTGGAVVLATATAPRSGRDGPMS